LAAKPAEEKATPVEKVEAAPKAGATKILVVDDSPSNLIVIQGQLRAYPVEVTTAKSGKEAIALYKANDYDVVLLDRMMPEMGGDETLQYIRDIEAETGKRAQVIMVTGTTKEEAMKEGDASLYDDFLEKPVVKEELDKVLAPFL